MLYIICRLISSTTNLTNLSTDQRDYLIYSSWQQIRMITPPARVLQEPMGLRRNTSPIPQVEGTRARVIGGLIPIIIVRFLDY